MVLCEPVTDPSPKAAVYGSRPAKVNCETK